MGDTIIFFDFSNPSAIKVESASEWDVHWHPLLRKQGSLDHDAESVGQ